MLKSFLLAKAKKENEFLVLFKDPVDVITVDRDTLVETILSVARRNGTILPAFQNLDHNDSAKKAFQEVTGTVIMTAASSDVEKIRAALKKAVRVKEEGRG